MSTIESLFFYGMAAFLIIGLLLLCYRIDQLEKELEDIKNLKNKWKPQNKKTIFHCSKKI